MSELTPTKAKKVPEHKQVKKEVPEYEQTEIEAPEQKEFLEIVPDQTAFVETIPEQTPLKEETPSILHEENCIEINGRLIEIKPTKLKYFRNRTVSIYGVLKQIPLGEFFAYPKGTFDKERDSDQILFDFLVAVFDDSEFVTENYDDFDIESFEKVLAIYDRLNHITEKEEAARKNREAQATAKR